MCEVEISFEEMMGHKGGNWATLGWGEKWGTDEEDFLEEGGAWCGS